MKLQKKVFWKFSVHPLAHFNLIYLLLSLNEKEWLHSLKKGTKGTY